MARSPVPGALAQAEVGSTDGSGARGTRRSPPQRNSVKVGGRAAASRKVGKIGWMLRNPSPAHSGEAFMRSRRKPSDLLPSDFMEFSWSPSHARAAARAASANWGKVRPIRSDASLREGGPERFDRVRFDQERRASRGNAAFLGRTANRGR
ncbi:hypothetical protein SBBP1_50056 [Burkholderiales bacterium]|nr:hypothetical protein SBBP1_50056 [Burkholderiales bacterium]